LQRLVESWGSESILNKIKQPLHSTCCLRGFQEKSSSLIQEQTLAYSVVRHDWIFKRHRVLWSAETKKKSFLATNTLDGFGEHKDKKVPHVYNLIYHWIFNVGAYFYAGGPGLLIQIHGILDSIKYQQIKNQNLTPSARNLIMEHGWIFYQDNNPKQTSKSTQKCVAQNEASAMTVPDPDLNHIENVWSERKRRITNIDLRI